MKFRKKYTKKKYAKHTRKRKYKQKHRRTHKRKGLKKRKKTRRKRQTMRRLGGAAAASVAVDDQHVPTVAAPEQTQAQPEEQSLDQEGLPPQTPQQQQQQQQQRRRRQQQNAKLHWIFTHTARIECLVKYMFGKEKIQAPVEGGGCPAKGLKNGGVMLIRWNENYDKYTICCVPSQMKNPNKEEDYTTCKYRNLDGQSISYKPGIPQLSPDKEVSVMKKFIKECIDNGEKLYIVIRHGVAAHNDVKAKYIDKYGELQGWAVSGFYKKFGTNTKKMILDASLSFNKDSINKLKETSKLLKRLFQY